MHLWKRNLWNKPESLTLRLKEKQVKHVKQFWGFFGLGHLPSVLKRSVIATEHNISYKFGVMGSTVPQSNTSVNKFHVREGTNANLWHSEKATSNSTPLKTRDSCLKFLKLISMHETSGERERKWKKIEYMNHAAKYCHYRSWPSSYSWSLTTSMLMLWCYFNKNQTFCIL